MIQILGYVLVVLDVLAWILTLGPLVTLYKTITARKVFAEPVPETVDINGEGQPPSKVWRSVEALAAGKLCHTFHAECKTAYDVLCHSYKTYGSLKAQGTRPLLNWQFDDGYKFPAKVFGTTEWRTYEDLGKAAHSFGCALRAVGATPQPKDASTVDHAGILIYDDTSAEWMIAAQGAFSQSVVVATAYATLGASAVQKAVVQGGVTVLVCNRKAVPAMLKIAPNMPTLKAIVYTDVLCTLEEKTNQVEKSADGPRVLSFAEALELGISQPFDPTPPSPTSLAVLMYTSGSTGDPKGVMVTQANLLAMMSAVKVQFGGVLQDGGDETYIGYLPLAHILELAAEFFFFATGNKVGYSDPKALLGGPEKAHPVGGLDEFQPTLMAGVPKVWEAIKAGAQLKIIKSGPTANALISLAIRHKAMATKQRRNTPLFNLLLKKIAKATGGKLKACLSGGGAISGEVQEWVRTALGCPVVQGYGLTETTGGVTVQMYDDLSIGIAGTPLSSIEVVLHSEPDITDSVGKPYLASDTVHSDGRACAGRGEVWVRGTNVTAGYYKMPELTKEEFRADGFFCTGDIGMLTPGGALVIIDRKKNLVKLKGGEYVALEKMNTAYNNSPFINVEAGGVCCQADDALDRAVCVAQCKSDELVKVAKTLGISESDPNALCMHGRIQEEVLKSFKVEAQKAELTMLETVVGVYPLVEPWSTENGCLTATQKLVPKSVWKHQKAEFEIIRKKGIK